MLNRNIAAELSTILTNGYRVLFDVEIQCL